MEFHLSTHTIHFRNAGLSAKVYGRIELRLNSQILQINSASAFARFFESGITSSAGNAG
jgi:hypothetical protein